MLSSGQVAHAIVPLPIFTPLADQILPQVEQITPERKLYNALLLLQIDDVLLNICQLVVILRRSGFLARSSSSRHWMSASCFCASASRPAMSSAEWIEFET